jgi:hypothetical protein
LRGDTGLVYNKTTDALTVAGLVTAGSATITGAATVGTTLGVTGVSTFASAVVTGDLTVDTSTLKVDSTNNRVGIGTSNPSTQLDIRSTAFTPSSTLGALIVEDKSTWSQAIQFYLNNAGTYNSSRPSGAIGAANNNAIWITGGSFISNNPTGLLGLTATSTDASAYVAGAGYHKWYTNSGLTAGNTFTATERYNIDSTGVSTWSVAGTTSMTLNTTGLLVGTTSDLTGANISSSKGLGTANIATNRFATVEYGSGASGAFTTITISVTVANSVTSVIIEALLTGYSGVYLDHVAGRYANQAAVVIRNNASVGTTAASLAVDGTGLIYTLTITTAVEQPVIKVKATAGGLGGSITLPVITFA